MLSLSSAGHGIAALGALLLAGPGGATSAANASRSASERRLLSSHGRSGGAAAATCSRMLRNRRPVWLVSMKRKLRCCFEPEASTASGDADFVRLRSLRTTRATPKRMTVNAAIMLWRWTSTVS